MDENLSRGYVQLGKLRGMNEFKLVNGTDHTTPPKDKYNLVYATLMLAGVGFLLPYNSFVIPVDYFQDRYPGTTVVFDMTVVYISMAFFAVCANNILVETISLDTRIRFGYVISFNTLAFVVMSEIWWEMFGNSTSYTINLIAVAIVSVGCTVQQSSFYGYTSMLPSRYTQAVMAGESLAGFWVSINRVLTKSITSNQRSNTSIFFILSIITIAVCSLLNTLIKKTDFVQFYIKLCQERSKITLEPTEDIGLMDPLDQVNDSKGQYGVLKLQTSPLGIDSCDPVTGAQYSAFSFSNPVYEPNSTTVNQAGVTGPTYKVEDIVVMGGSYGNQSKPWTGIKRGLLARYEVAKLIYPYMISIGFAYFVTLCLYPGIVSEIKSCKFESWMPVILMATFNGADLLGKILASIPYEWTRTQLLYFSGARIILIPLFLLCAIPRHAPILSSEVYPVLFSWLLGLTNGIVGSVPMIQAPSKVPEEHRELAGNIMTLSYTFGLALGSLLAYMLDACLGVSVNAHQICFNQLISELDVREKLTTMEVLTSTIANTTSASIMKISNRIPDIRTTASSLTTILTTSVIANQTFGLIGSNIPNVTTESPITLSNITSTISNAIIPH
ncbi:equilibrative nucleoside transporter 4 [Chelonus insularis]|uniref:equilibrative nucleoside transporter 4 n=1 Tax=Chelonus insularis TaxID=460826 RepID=UPI00158886F2|nr:equilibrative nucleoside transporter 4 [Chelonus insularis]